ncbi:hypothetical protein TWF696_000425 [Orbilia brochopaga]|uniref:Uncharacterized protein n=1 Tax=Orbilia brochopaga TaxID=3140254 RepID=A0AAV9VB95_9PEZI
MDDLVSGANLTLVGMALRAQKPGQPFSSAAIETLQKHFPGMSPAVLVERANNLQKARDLITVQKYGNVITMKPASDTLSDSSRTSRVSTPKVAVSPPRKSDSSPTWSLPQASPDDQNVPPKVRPSDLDGLIIDHTDSDCSDSEDDADSPEATPLPICMPRKRPHTGKPEILTPMRGIPSTRAMASPQTVIKRESSPKKRTATKSKTPATVVPFVDPSSTTEPDSSSMRSPDNSPIKSLLTNRAARLRTQSNLKKISSYESPRPGLNFDMSTPKSPVAPRPVPRIDEEDELRAIEAYLRALNRPLSPDGNEKILTDQQYRDINDEIETEETESSLTSSDYQSSSKDDQKSADLGSSSPMIFPMDEDIQLQAESDPSDEEATQSGICADTTLHRHPSIDCIPQTGYTTLLFDSGGSERSDTQSGVNFDATMESPLLPKHTVTFSPRAKVTGDLDSPTKPIDVPHGNKVGLITESGEFTLHFSGDIVINLQITDTGRIRVQEQEIDASQASFLSA